MYIRDYIRDFRDSIWIIEKKIEVHELLSYLAFFKGPGIIWFGDLGLRVWDLGLGVWVIYCQILAGLKDPEQGTHRRPSCSLV